MGGLRTPESKRRDQAYELAKERTVAVIVLGGCLGAVVLALVQWLGGGS